MTGFTRRFPVLSAAALYAGLVSLAFWRFWTGAFLINPLSDASTGYAFRKFAAQYFKANHDVPQWDPYIFGGLPFAAGHGDALYPTFLLRLVFPVDVGITLGFMIHIVLAGLFTFLFLRNLKLAWGPSFLGGAAYLFTGQVVSMVSPGHDGKLFVSALLPLGLMFLQQAVTRGSWQRYLLFGVVVGFSILTPHYQMTYYLLMAAGFYWAYLVFLSGERPAAHAPARSLVLFGAAIAVGFALAAAQVMPFYEYLKFSPRAATGGTSTGWAYATSWAMAPEETLNVVWPAFSGILENYWGKNPFKLHSEYLGISVLMLATLGFQLRGGRRFAWFLTALTGYALVFSWAGSTPFYYIPYYLLPGIKLTRAAAMIFFLASFSTAVLAAMGAQALLDESEATPIDRRPLLWWAGGAAVVMFLALVGVVRPIMEALAPPERFEAIARNYPSFEADAVRVLIVALAAAAGCWRLSLRQWRTAALAGIVVLDLWSVERRFIQWSPPAAEAFAADGVVGRLEKDPGHYRVLGLGLYLDTYLMDHGIRSVLGYHGNELHSYDELLGGKNIWKNAGSPNLWKLLAVKYIVVPDSVQVPGLVSEGGRLDAHGGQPAFLYRVQEASPFAFLVRQAVKLPEEQIVSTLMDRRFDPHRLLLLPPNAPAGVTNLSALPDSMPGKVTVEEPRAGKFRLTLETPPAEPAYLFLAENYFPDWRAEVDGQVAPVLRAQYTLMAVPLAAGSKVVTLEFHSDWDALGRWVSLVVTVGLLAIGGAGLVFRRRVAGD